MDDLTRFAQQLADRLGSRPEGFRPVTVGEVRENLLPYRKQRAMLGLASVEEYETVLVRLVAEERGYVRTSPPEAAARCREVLTQPDPDLGVLEEVNDSTIQLTSMATRKVVEDQPAKSNAGPFLAPANIVDRTGPASLCRYCSTAIPSERTVVFCPWCGKRLIPVKCSKCSTELEPEWRHCITCGAPAPDSTAA